jgi:hypothetical protein
LGWQTQVGIVIAYVRIFSSKHIASLISTVVHRLKKILDASLANCPDVSTFFFSFSISAEWKKEKFLSTRKLENGDILISGPNNL